MAAAEAAAPSAAGTTGGAAGTRSTEVRGEPVMDGECVWNFAYGAALAPSPLLLLLSGAWAMACGA